MEQSIINLVAHNQFEFTLIEPLTDIEVAVFQDLKDSLDIDLAVSQSRRVVLFDCDELTDATEVMSSMGLIEEIGLIKHITTYEPQWSDNENNIIVTLE